MSAPLVTVVMNCFNGEVFLRQAIDSIIAQTWTNWEIVFWDNQSTDRSAEIVHSYGDSRIRYFYAPTHTLLYEARNYAIEHARGDLLAFLDVDDWWLPEKLEQQIVVFRDESVAVACTNFWVENERKAKRWVAYSNPLPQGHVLDKLLKNYQVGLLTLVLRRSALPTAVAPFDPRYHIIGDFDLVLRMAAAHKVASIQQPLAVYRIHGGNESARRRERHVTELECWCSEMSLHPVISVSKAFLNVRSHTEYVRAMGSLLNGQRKEAFAAFMHMHWGRLKLRLLVALLLPTAMLQHVKN